VLQVATIADQFLKYGTPLAILVLGFWLKDIWWENRKRVADYNRSRLADCIGPLFVRLFTQPEMFSGTYVQDHLTPIVNRFGYMLLPGQLRAFQQLADKEAEYRGAKAKLDQAVGHTSPEIARAVSLKLEMGLSLEDFTSRLTPEEVHALRNLATTTAALDEWNRITSELAEKAGAFYNCLREDFGSLAARYNWSQGAIEYKMSPPPWKGK
jgi:hypothetical protein